MRYFSASATHEEVRRAISNLLADARLRVGTVLFIDNRGVTSTPTTGEVAAIAREWLTGPRPISR